MLQFITPINLQKLFMVTFSNQPYLVITRQVLWSASALKNLQELTLLLIRGISQHSFGQKSKGNQESVSIIILFQDLGSQLPTPWGLGVLVFEGVSSVYFRGKVANRFPFSRQGGCLNGTSFSSVVSLKGVSSNPLREVFS